MNVNVMYEPIETVHLYVVREQAKKPFTFLPLYAAVCCLAFIVGVTTYSALHPTYEHETLTIPAHFLPLQVFTATQVITPTGIQTYPATTAHGMLTITNGSILSGELPKGITVTGKNGVEVVTDTPVYIPAGSADGYGYATVSAHAASSGKAGNIPAYAIDGVESSSIYVRNLQPFTGGKDAYAVRVVTPKDKQAALATAHTVLASQEARIHAILAAPCNESVSWGTSVYLSWTCQFVANPSLPGMQITAIRLCGKNLLVDVMFIAHPKRRWVR